MGQYFAVALIVALAAVYVGSKYLPAAWRRRVVYLLTRRGASQSKLVRWFDTGSSCGSGCDSCGSCATQAAPPVEGRRVIRLHVDSSADRVGTSAHPTNAANGAGPEGR